MAENLPDLQFDDLPDLTFDKLPDLQFDGSVDAPKYDVEYVNDTAILSEDIPNDYKYVYSTEEQRSEWDKKGPITWTEAFKRQDKLELLPFVGALSVVDDIQVLNSIKNLQADDYMVDGIINEQAKKKDQESVTAYMNKVEEERYRGFHWGAKVYTGASNLMPMMVEFGLTGPVYGAGKAVAKKAVTKVIGEGVETFAKKAVLKGVPMVAGSAARTSVLANRYYPKYKENQILANTAITDKGIGLLKESDETPAKSFVKAYGDTMIEVFSESLGGEVFRPVAGKLVSKVSPKAKEAIVAFMNKIPAKNRTTDLLRKGGMDNLVEELGEEEVGRWLRGAFNVEGQEGNIFERIAEQFPSMEDRLVEVGVFSIPGAVSGASRTLSARLKRRGATQQEVDSLDSSLSQLEKEAWLKEDTLKRDAVYELAQSKIEAREDLSAEEEAVIEERYYEYVDEGLIEGEVDTASTEVQFQAMEEVEKQRTRAIEEGMDLLYPKKKVTKEELIEKVGKYKEAEKKLKQLKTEKAEAKDIKATQKELLMVAEDNRKDLLKRIKPGESVETKEQTDLIPAQYKNKKGQTIDEVAEEYTDGDINLLVKMINDLESNVVNAREELGLAKEKVKEFTEKTVEKTNIKELQDTVAAFKSGMRSGKADIKKYQTDFINMVKKSSLEAKDKAKFLSAIKEANTEQKFEQAVESFRKRAESLIVAQEKRELKAKIKKELDTIGPVKKGQKQVSKYDYSTNKTLQEVKRINSLTEKAAAEELFSTPDAKSEIDLIKRRLLSLKALGNKASPELRAQVYTDIRNLKKVGLEAKSDTDFEKRLGYGERVEELIDKNETIKGDKKKLFTKMGNAYRRGLSNIESFLGSMYGKKLADKLNPEIQEDKKQTAVFEKTKEITKEAEAIYGVDNFSKYSVDMARDKQELYGNDGTKYEVSTLDIIDIYNSINNEPTKENYYKHYGQVQIDGLVASLSVQDKRFGDMLMDKVQEYRSVLNERNIEITGTDLGFVENYWPRKSETQQEFFDDIRLQGETPSALKARASSVKPIPSNVLLKANKHISEAEHIKHLSRKYEELKRIFSNTKLKSHIENKYGKEVYGALMAQIEQISLNNQIKSLDMISGIFGKALNNWVSSKVAFNPTTFARQLGSTINFAENMPMGKWTKGFFEGVADRKKTFDFMWKNAPFLEARFNRGYSEALESSMRGAEQIGGRFKGYTDFLTSFTRIGDMTAIIYGGYPLVKHEMSKGKTKEEAFEIFRKSMIRSQQSGLKSSLSAFQQSSTPFARIFLAFKNTSNQYFRKMTDAVINFQNGEISGEQFVKTMTNYAIIQPILYTALGAVVTAPFKMIGGDEEEELVDKAFNDLMVQLMVNPFLAMPIIDDATKAAARMATNQKVYQIFNTPVLDEFEKAGRKAMKKETTAEDWLTAVSALQEPVTGLPTGTAIRYYNYLKGE